MVSRVEFGFAGGGPGLLSFTPLLSVVGRGVNNVSSMNGSIDTLVFIGTASASTLDGDDDDGRGDECGGVTTGAPQRRS
jgi:hypothetical protein